MVSVMARTLRLRRRGRIRAGPRVPTTARGPTGATTRVAGIVPEIADETLVAAALEGDDKALDLLLRRHHDRVHALCRRLAGNDADAADATQEALITIVRRLDRFDGKAKFTTWLYRVTTNACLDELRRRKRRPTPTDDIFLADTPSRGPSVDGQVADRLDIDAALAELSPDFRAAVVLRDLCGLDYAEIAEVLDLAPGTVRSRISRGRGALAHVMAGNPNPTSDRPTETP
jgi:RNA polymerase sigma-70 factor (ECF subfamily)